ncbi:hypothetical protein ABZ930_07070 [Streptomyces sp. NPDC046716]|uniref:hypothetical protein n=1 Tax=Streptomyces sp. NPDC046716 TaxID=3157093 RepID=UPI0033F1F9F2
MRQATGRTVPTLTGCTRTEANKRADCRTAIENGGTRTNRPDACRDLTEDDYQSLGFLDQDGNIDLDKVFGDD